MSSDKAKKFYYKFLKAVEKNGIFFAVFKTLQYPFSRLMKKIKDRRISKIFALENTEDRFTKIAQVNYWRSKESVSGPGSTLNSTENLRQKLPELFERFAIADIFDAPCGDFNWMKLVVRNNNVNYTGADIVKPLIKNNLARFKNANTNFLHLDITKQPFPKADLWICRDCLFHFSFADTLSALNRYLESEIPYVLTSTYKNTSGFDNSDIKTGHWRLIDLFSAPYLFPQVTLFRIDDYLKSERPREMCLWSREQTASAVAKFTETLV